MRILVTGGAGFIGSNFVRLLAQEQPTYTITILDKLTYAGNLENLEGVDCRFVRGDICDAQLMIELLADSEVVVNFAAESHVDRSILDSSVFMKTNVHGTYVLLEAARQTKLKRFLHVSTDEVYGDMLPEQFALEDSPLRPSSPYAASKAAAEMLVMSYAHTYGLPAVITRASNNYGPYQFPEKLMPLMITNALEHKPLPVYGDGLQQRDWLHVDDHCRALSLLIENGETGEVYNVGNGVPRTNMEVLKTLLQLLERPTTLLQRVTDRPGHDRRYALNCEKLKTKLHWQPKEDFEQGLRKTVEWYRSHPEWVSEVKAGTYRDYYDHHYLRRDETLAAFSNPSVAEQR